MNVLANDGISKEGALKLNEAGFNTTVESIDQSKIIDYINDNNIEGVLRERLGNLTDQRVHL